MSHVQRILDAFENGQRMFRVKRSNGSIVRVLDVDARSGIASALTLRGKAKRVLISELFPC